ncbi:MAG TPA: hypothetical protein PKC79_10125 [Solidesulfovibrio magneticus]|nr:hypothetical protein [Solidesulfovibrio magneticus]
MPPHAFPRGGVLKRTLPLFLAGLAAVCAACLAGAYPAAPGDVLAVLARAAGFAVPAPADPALPTVVMELRLTRALLAYGVGAALAATRCPKVFVPNTGTDPELLGHTLELQVERLLRHLRGDAPDAIAPRDVLDFVLVDTKGGRYPGGIPRAMLQRLGELGIRVLDCPLVSRQSAPYIDERLLNPVLLSLC